MRHANGVISTDTKEIAFRVVERLDSVTVETWLDGEQVDGLYITSSSAPFDSGDIADRMMNALRDATRVQM